jgi:hypothetical protein
LFLIIPPAAIGQCYKPVKLPCPDAEAMTNGFCWSFRLPRGVRSFGNAARQGAKHGRAASGPRPSFGRLRDDRPRRRDRAGSIPGDLPRAAATEIINQGRGTCED